MHADFLVAGAGIFGVCTAIELRSRGYSVILLNPDEIPHPLAASTDISKIIRMEYGSDSEYMDMAIASMAQWQAWNENFQEKLYEDIGYIILSRSDRNDLSSYEASSVETLLDKGFEPEILSSAEIKKRFPAFNVKDYKWGSYHSIGGFAHSGKAVSKLCNYAKSQGVEIHLKEVQSVIHESGRFTKVKASDGSEYSAGHLVLCTGNFTPYLLPELKPYMKITGHPVFHLKPMSPEAFSIPAMTVFAADIANTGWYGFPLHPEHGVVKIANHSVGLELDPRTDPREVNEEDVKNLRHFLSSLLPDLVDAPIVYTRRCCYTDTLDGHFWIDNHPGIDGITIGTGGSGHGFKMGPETGRMIACTALGEEHGYSDRYLWRELGQDTIQKEEARNN